jgi:hypothetical protein
MSVRKTNRREIVEIVRGPVLQMITKIRKKLFTQLQVYLLLRDNSYMILIYQDIQ